MTEFEKYSQESKKDKKEDDVKIVSSKALAPPANTTFTFNMTWSSYNNLYFYYSPIVDRMVWSFIGTADQGATKDMRMAWLWWTDPSTTFKYILLNLDYSNTPDNQRIWKQGVSAAFPNVYALTSIYTPGKSGNPGKYEGLSIQLAYLNGTTTSTISGSSSTPSIYISTWDWQSSYLQPNISSITPPPGFTAAPIAAPSSSKPFYVPVSLTNAGTTIIPNYNTTGTNAEMLKFSRRTASACLCRDRIFYALELLPPTSCAATFVRSFLPSTAASTVPDTESLFKIVRDVIATLGYLPPYFQPIVKHLQERINIKMPKTQTKITKKSTKSKSLEKKKIM
jgi:hypothetical protein